MPKKKNYLEYWDYKKNIVNPLEVNENDTQKYWWLCKKNHSYKKTINHAMECPYCSGELLLTDFNDLKTKYPKLAKEFDCDKNKITPNKVSYKWTKSYHWNATCGHTFKQTINERIKNKYKCPYCTGKEILAGFNDIITLNPELSASWDYNLNTNIDITKIKPDTARIVWWICKDGHHFKESIKTRFYEGEKCPYCLNETTPEIYPEKIIYYYVKQYFPDARINVKDVIPNKELDIYVPSLKIAIEYDGESFHKKLKKDIEKNEICKQNNIEILRIREKHCPLMDKKYKNYRLKTKTFKELEKIIKKILLYLIGETIEINIEKDKNDIIK